MSTEQEELERRAAKVAANVARMRRGRRGY